MEVRREKDHRFVQPGRPQHPSCRAEFGVRYANRGPTDRVLCGDPHRCPH